MTKIEYINSLKKAWEAGEITEEAYDAGMMNIDAFTDEEDE